MGSWDRCGGVNKCSVFSRVPVASFIELRGTRTLRRASENLKVCAVRGELHLFNAETEARESFAPYPKCALEVAREIVFEWETIEARRTKVAFVALGAAFGADGNPSSLRLGPGD